MARKFGVGLTVMQEVFYREVSLKGSEKILRRNTMT
jgi:hypothetical protein